MTDRRRLRANGRVAELALKGVVEAEHFTAGTLRQVIRPVVDLLAQPGGARDRQVLLGAEVTEYEARDGWSFIAAKADGYVGYVPTDALGAPQPVTHWVTARSTHLYASPKVQAPQSASLSFGSRVVVTGQEGRWAETPEGFLPAHMLAPVGETLDVQDVARRFLGTPYLWGGNSGWGIDCSGLVQAALIASGHPCPGDSDQQEAELGAPVEEPRKGDLVFWRGHVALMADDTTLIHANAHDMAVALEPHAEAVARIEAQGDGPVTGIRRL